MVMYDVHCTACWRAIRSLVIVAMTAGLVPAISVAAEPPPRAVLILDHEDPGRNFYVAYSAALRAAVRAGSAGQVTVYAENMDRGRFDGPNYQELLRRYLRE